MRAGQSTTLRLMKRSPVESSSIASVGYDAKRRTLEIEFVHGVVYQYVDVSAEVHVALLEAESKGRFLNDAIRDVFQCFKVPSGSAH